MRSDVGGAAVQEHARERETIDSALRPALRLSILARDQADHFLGKHDHKHDHSDKHSRLAHRDVAQKELLNHLGELKSVLTGSNGSLRVAGPEAVDRIVSHVESIQIGSKSAKDQMEAVSREIFALQKMLISFSDQKVVHEAQPPREERNFFVKIFNKVTHRGDTRFPSRVSEEERSRLRSAAESLMAEHEAMLESVRRVRRSVERGEPVTETLSRKGIAEYDRQLRGEAGDLGRLVSRVSQAAKGIPALRSSVDGLISDLDQILKTGQARMKQLGGFETKPPLDYSFASTLSGLMEVVGRDIPKDAREFVRLLEPGSERSVQSLAAWDRSIRFRQKEFQKIELSLLTMESQAREFVSGGEEFRTNLSAHYSHETDRLTELRKPPSEPVLVHAEIRDAQRRSLASGQPIFVPGWEGGGAVYGPRDKHYSGLKIALERGYTATLTGEKPPAFLFLTADGLQMTAIKDPIGKKSAQEFSRSFELLVRQNLKTI